MRFKKLLPRTLLVISLVLVIAVILTTRSAFVSAEEDVSAEEKLQIGQQNSDPSQLSSSEKCPCIAIEDCPRMYGHSALDITQIGIVSPCPENGTVRCCGVTISVVQKSDDDAQKSMIFSESPEESAGEYAETTTEEFNINFENAADEMQVDHVQEQSLEIIGNNPSTNSNETSSSENLTMINMDSDLEPGESVMIKTFDTQSTHKGPRGPKARRRKIKTSVNSVLTLNGNENTGSNVDENNESFHNTETPSGNNNPDFDSSSPGNPDRVIISAFAEDTPSSRLATTTIILDSTSDKKLPNLLSRTRKLTTAIENTETSIKNLGISSRNDSVNISLERGGGFSPIKPGPAFSRTNFFSSKSQSGSNTRSSASTTGTTHFATSVSGLHGKFKRPSFSSLPQATLPAENVEDGIGGFDLISTSGETLHVSPLDQEDNLESTESPIAPGGRKKIISFGFPSHTSTFGTSSNSTSSNFMSAKTKARNFHSGVSGGASSSSQTSPNLANIAEMNLPQPNATKSFNNDALTSDTQTPKTSSSSLPSMPVFVPKIRPFLPKRTDGTSNSPSISISPSKKEQEQDAKTTTTEEILVQKGNKSLSFSLLTPSKLNLPVKTTLKSHALSPAYFPTISNTSDLSVMQNSSQGKLTSSYLPPSSSSFQVIHPTPVAPQIITTPPQVGSGELYGKVNANPGLRRRKIRTTTTTPAPLEINELEKEEDFPRITLSRPLLTQTKPSFPSSSLRKHSGFSKNKSNAYESVEPSIPVSTAQTVPISQTVETNDITSPPALTGLNRGYRRRVRPLAKVHLDDSATSSLSAPPTTQILTMPKTGSITTPQPRVHAHPSSSPENQNGNDENTNDFTPAAFQQKDIDLQKGNKKTNDDISTSNTQTDKIKHGHFANKLHRPILISTHAPVLTPTENILFVEHNAIDKSQNHQDFVSPSVSTDSSANAYTDSADGNNGKRNHNAPRRKVVVNRIFRTTTTTAPLVLTRPNGITLSKQEESHPESSMNYNPGSVTSTPASANTINNNERGKHPVRMTSTYSRIRVNKQNEEEAPLNHGIAQTNTNNRRFRIPTNLQVIREHSSSSTTPTSVSVSFNSNNRNANNNNNEALSITGVKNSQPSEEVRPEDEEQPANYDGGSTEQQKVVSEEGTESYDLVLDKEARKSMQNQTTDQNSFPPPHAPSPSSENKFHSAPQPATVLPQRVNHDRHMVKVKRRRRPVTVAPVTTIPAVPAEGEKQSSMNVKEGSEEEHLIEQQPVEALFVKLSGEENLAGEGDNERKVGEKNENVDESDVDIDLKVNIDVTVDGNADDKAELQIEDAKQVESIGVEYEEEIEEVESAGEQEESRLHANYVKGKFSVTPSFSSASSPNDNDAINYNSYSSPVVTRLENNSSKSLTSHAENEVSRNSGGIKSFVSVLAVDENEPMHSTVPATHVSPGQRIRKTQKGNSTVHGRFPASIDINSNIVNKTRSSKIGQSQLVDTVGKQVGHSFDSGETNSFRKPSATKTNEMRHSSHNANSPTRLSYSSTNLNTGTGNNVVLSQSAFPTHHLIRRPGGGHEEDIKQSHHERFNIHTLDKNNNIHDSNASNDNNETTSGIRTRNNYRLTGGLSPTKTKTTTQLPPTLPANTETEETTLETPFVFPPYRKSQSVLIVTSTPEPLSSFNPTGLRYNPALKYRSTTTTPASFTTTSTNNLNSVGNVVEFHSQPTRTAPTIPSPAPASFNIVNTSSRNRNANNVDNNKAVYNSKHIAEHEQSRFSVSQVKSQVSPSVNNNVTEPRKRIRKKNKTKVNTGVYKENDVYIESTNSPGAETKGMNTFNNSPMTSYKNEQESNVKQVTPSPTYTSFSVTLENEAKPPPQYLPATTTTTENAFSYQIIPTEAPFRYIPTSPIPPQVFFSPAPFQKARPVSKPAISVQYQDSHSSQNPSMTDEFTQEKNSRTSSRFSVPEKFDFSGWRVTNSMTTVSPIILTTTETPTTPRPAVRVSHNEIQNPPPLNSIRIASTPQNVPTTTEHKYPEQMATSFVWSPAESHSVSSGHHTSQRPLLLPQVNLQAQKHLHTQPQQTHHIQNLPEFQNLNVQKHHTQNVANYQLETKPLERPPAFDNQFNYQLTSNGQSYSIQLAETKPISNNAPSTKLSPPNNNLPGVVASSSPSIVPTQHHSSQATSHSAQQPPISFHSPTTQLNLQTLSSRPSAIPQTKQHQHQQQQQMPVLHTQTANSQYQTNAFQPPVIDEDKRQNYFQPSGPTSYTLPILPQHNSKVPNAVRIQFGEDVGLQDYKENIRNQNQTAYQQYSQPTYSHPSQFYSDNISPSTAFVYNPEESDSNKNVFPVSTSPAPPALSWQSQSQFSPVSTPHYYPEQFSASKWSMNNNNTHNINNFNSMKQTGDHYNLKNQQNQAQNVYHSPNGFKHTGNQSPLPLKQLASAGSMFYSPEPQRQPLVNLPHPENGNNNNIPSYQYNSAMPANQNIPMESLNNNFQHQQQKQQPFRVNGAGQISGSQQQQQQAKPGVGVSFSSQGYNGNPIVNQALASPILHGLPVSVQKQLPPIHQKEYQQHMQISQHIMNHMNRYSGRTSRAKNINGGHNDDSKDGMPTDLDLNGSGSDTVEVESHLGDETYNTNFPVPQEFVTMSQRENSTENMHTQKDYSITNNSTNSDSNENRLKGELESNQEKLMVEESMVKEVVDKNVRGVFNSALLLQNNKVVTESPNSESEKNRITSDVSGEMKTKAMLVPDLESDTKGVEAEARGVGSNVKESSSVANLNPNMNFTAEGNNKTEFTPPKVIQGGFVPILPYSEKDPGPILVKMQPIQEKILSPTEQQISAMNRLNHPNLIQQSNFRSQLHEQINKLYVNTVKSMHHPK